MNSDGSGERRPQASRRRARRWAAPAAGSVARIAALATVGALAAACGSAAIRPAGATGPAASQANRQCTTSALKVTLGPGQSAAGSFYLPLRLTNISSARCTLHGYPGVSFVTGQKGRQIGNPAGRRPQASASVSLRPRAVASALLQVANRGSYPAWRCHPTSAPYLRIYPPNQTAPRDVKSGPIAHDACASKSVISLHVGPVKSGANG